MALLKNIQNKTNQGMKNNRISILLICFLILFCIIDNTYGQQDTLVFRTIDLNKKERVERERLISEFPNVPRDSIFIGIIDTTFMSTIIHRASLYITLRDGRKFNTSASGMACFGKSL